MEKNEIKRKLLQDRWFFVGVLCTIILCIALLDRKSLLNHPSVAAEAKRLERIELVAPDEPVTNVIFVLYDTETTGLDPAIDRVIELAAVRFHGGQVTGEKSWLLNPERFVPADSTAIHHISPEMLAGKPCYRDIHDEFMTFIEGAVLIAHNARFDVTMMNMEFERAGKLPPPNLVLDSLKFMRTWHPDASEHNLKALAEMLGVKEDGALHRAGTDSVYIGLILHKTVITRNPSMPFSELRKAAEPVYYFDRFTAP